MKKLSLAVFNTQPPHLYPGGVERRILETAKRLRNQANVTIYSGTKKGFHQSLTIDGATLIPCFSTDILYPIDNWFFNRTIERVAESIDADVYEAHAVSGYRLQKVLELDKTNKPFVQTIHGVLADEYAQSFQNAPLTLRGKIANLSMRRLAMQEKQVTNKATLIVTVSNYSAEKIMQLYGVDQAKIRVVTNGVDTIKFAPVNDTKVIRKQIGVENRQCVLFVGSLIHRKGLNHLVEAANHVTKECKETVFVIVGDGPQKTHLVRQLDKLNLLGSFVFLGDVRDSTLSLLYNCADVFVLPSIQEGLGIVLLEAQATEKPVVAFNIGGVREALINGESGLLVKPDSRELAEALLKLLADGSLRQQMGRKGRAFVRRNFSWDICAVRMLKVYQEALAINS